MNMRGIFPSLGAGGSLTAAVLCAAAIVGGGLAFRGDAGGTAEANTGDVNVPAATVRAPASSVRASGPGLSRATSARRRPTLVAAAPRRGTTRATVRRGAGEPRAMLTPRATVPASAPRPSAPRPVTGTKPAPPVAAPPAPTKPSGTVSKTVEQVRHVAKPVVDAVPEPVQSHVQTVTDTVQQVAGVVDQTVDGVTGGLLP
jgi:hypothetical protein